VSVSAAEVLGAWEAGWGRTPLHRAGALAVLATGRSPAEVSAWPLGERDLALYALHAELFGPVLDAVATCPGCGTEVELRLDQEQIVTAGSSTRREARVSMDGRSYRFRTPTSADIAAVLAVPAHEATAALVDRCLLDGDAGTFAADPLPVLSAWEEADPLADITLGLNCPECAREWAEPLDIAGFLWSKLEAWCRRTLVEVHELARAYGWSESEILRLSPWRRDCYLGLVTT
jgi:hypothetical protein